MSETSDSRRTWTLLAGLAFGLVFLYIALREADVGSAIEVLKHTQIIWIFPVILSGMAFLAVKSWRWSVILRPVTHRTFSVLHRAVYIGTAANLVVAHTGELIRTRMLAKNHSVASGAVLASIAIERVLDFVALLVFAGVAMVIDPRVSPLLWSAGVVSLVLIGIGLVTVVALLNPGPAQQRLGRLVLSVLPDRAAQWVGSHIQKSIAGLGVLREPKTVFKLIALSLLQWSGIVFAIWSCVMATGINIPLSGAIAVFVLTVISLTLPSLPAQLGTLQLAFVVALELIGADPANAFAASLVYTCFINGTMMVIGAACWFLRHDSVYCEDPESAKDGAVRSDLA